ncbi:MAG: hypothetical protein AB7K86_18425 [Rhodospirillales bacterium]
MSNAPAVSLTFDVEWACDAVVADVVRALDERGLPATFFCTHAGIDVGGHERALHPNFRRAGNTTLAGPPQARDGDHYRAVLAATHAFAPEAVGTRSHSLFFDSDLLPVYRDRGLRYDSSYFLPLAADLAPVERGNGIALLPVWYMDYWDLGSRATGMRVTDLPLDAPGLKVFDFHPNLIALNANDLAQYTACKPYYRDPERLRAARQPGRGVANLFLELLDTLAAGRVPVAPLKDIAGPPP